MKHQNLAIGVGIALIVPASLGLLLSGVPTIVCPFPILTVIPAFLLGKSYWLAVLVSFCVSDPKLTFSAASLLKLFMNFGFEYLSN
jgi:hypothetical protein